jgi:hypothetical protein
MNKKILIGALLTAGTTALSGMAQAWESRDGHRGHRYEGRAHSRHGGHDGGRGYHRPYSGIGLGIAGFGMGYYAGTRNTYSYGTSYYPPVYSTPYYPQTIVVSPPPTVYIEQSPPQMVQAPSASYWYSCASPEGYYPHIKECPGGWQTVPAVPPSPDFSR